MPLEDLGGALERLEVAAGELAHARRQVGVLAPAQAAQALAAAVVELTSGAAAVAGSGAAVDQPAPPRASASDARRGRSLIRSQLGQLARRQRPVALDRRQRRALDGLSSGAGLLAQAAGRAGYREPQVRRDRGDVLASEGSVQIPLS